MRTFSGCTSKLDLCCQHKGLVNRVHPQALNTYSSFIKLNMVLKCFTE